MAVHRTLLSPLADQTVPSPDCTCNTCRTSSADSAGGSASARILTSVYSCGLAPSPLARSWSAHGCPSSGEYTDRLRVQPDD